MTTAPAEVDAGASDAAPAEAPPVLVLTLFCGENEFDAMCDSLACQTYTNWTHTVFRDMPNAAAHTALYRTIMAERTRFTYFLKLDADMVLSRPTALADVVAFAAARPQVDHFRFPVHDFFTQRRIPEIHVYSNRVHWPFTGDAVFVDPMPEIPGQRLVHNGPPAPFVDHAPDPDPWQSFTFGVHRALKAFQPDRRAKRHYHTLMQFRVLTDALAAYRRFGDRRHLLVIAGADLVARGKIRETTSYKDDPRVVAAYRALKGCSEATILAGVSPFWHSPWRRRVRLWRLLGLGGLRFRIARRSRRLAAAGRPRLKRGVESW
jgi:hypothetical protein